MSSALQKTQEAFWIYDDTKVCIKLIFANEVKSKDYEELLALVRSYTEWGNETLKYLISFLD